MTGEDTGGADGRDRSDGGGERGDGAEARDAVDGAGGRGDGEPERGAGAPPENDGGQFDRLPATPADRVVPGRPSREAVLDWWEERFGIEPATFAEHSFWEKGNGKVWAVHAAVDHPDPSRIEALGMTVLRTRQEHWKPTTNAVQRFGAAATRNVIVLGADAAARFVAGRDQEVAWDGDWGYLIAAHDLAGDRVPLGVGLYLHGELRSQVPKGRRQEHRE
jgi:NOL1/NOP2/fmu family ribosome biogenesis protein